MRLTFTKEKIQKRYTFKYTEDVNIEDVVNSNKVDVFTVDMASIWDRIAFSGFNSSNVEEGELEEVMESSKAIFKIVDFRLDNTGKIIKINNYEAINKKWNTVKSQKLSHITDVNRKNFIFEISKTIKNEEYLTKLIRYYNVFPYLFLGLYNHDYTTGIPFRAETTVYNIFPLTKLPVVLDIYGKEEGKNKVLKFTGKEKHDFDRFLYMEIIGNKYPELREIDNSIFDAKIEGEYIYDENSSLSNFEINVNIKAKGVVKYNLNYSMSEVE